MLHAIHEFLERHTVAPSGTGDERQAIQIATAVLLVEVVRTDHEIGPAEREAVLRVVGSRFGLGSEEAQALVRHAEEKARQATDFYQFTSLINERFSPQQKEQVIEYMWRVAYADAELSAYEQHLVRKIADLLYVPHRAYIAAKLRARDAVPE